MFQQDILKDHIGIITGGSSGIGMAIARYLVQHGAKITITGRDPEKLAVACAELGENVYTCAGDVRDGNAVERNMDDHMKHYGRVDFLINNAAGNFLCPLDQMSENAFMSVLNIVAKGTFLWSKAVQKHMKAQGSGSIVNIGTTYSWAHAAWVGHSGAAKAAVLNLTRTMAVEWGPYGIRTNFVAPGPVKSTEGFRRLMPTEAGMQSLHKLMPIARPAEPWEIAATVLFLLTPLAAYINGAAIPVDGGAHLTVPGLLPAGIDIKLPRRDD